MSIAPVIYSTTACIASFNLVFPKLDILDAADRMLCMDKQKTEYAVLKRRWTDELTQAESTARGLKFTRGENNAKYTEEEGLKQLLEDSDENDKMSVTHTH